MSEINVFLEATRRALRFDAEAHTGLTTEQLWNLPLTTTRANQSSLEGAGKVVKKALREQEEDSIVSAGVNRLRDELELKYQVLVSIVTYKQAENASNVAAAVKVAERDRLRQILETKKAEALGNLSVEEIEKRLADLR